MLDKLTDLARSAGEAILEVYSREDFGTTYKEDRTPLTEADKAANRIIVDGLRDIAPDVPVLSEESREAPYDERRGWTRFFLVDPLDGTKEFLKRNGEFTVNIALIDRGSPAVGVVHAPALGVTYGGVRGVGAFREDEKGAKTPIRAGSWSSGAFKVVASRSHLTDEVKSLVEGMREAGMDVEFVSMGSSLKLCLVAEGSAHLYPRFGPTMEWDTGAAQCVVEAAGGTVTDLEGDTLRYNREDLLNPWFVVAGSPPFPWSDYMG